MATAVAFEPQVDVPHQSRPAGLTLERRADGRVWLLDGAREIPVWVSRCFPWSQPDRFFALRDEEGDEVALVREIVDLDLASQQVMRRALDEAGFVFDITGVCEIEDEVEIRRWSVLTAQGPRTFQTRLDDWPVPLPEAGFLIRDLSGDLFRLPQPEQLDRKSRKLLWAFVD